jgi:hypothetical protein
MNAERRTNVDALIDGLVPEMTGGGPSDALRAEVLRRIEAPPPRTLVWRLRAAAVAAVVAVAAVMWQWDERAAVRPVPERAAANVPAPARRDANVPTPAPRDATAVTVSAGQQTSADREASQAGRRIARQNLAPANEPGVVEIEPLAIDPLRPAALVADAGRPWSDIDIDPIPIRPLTIAALASDDTE